MARKLKVQADALSRLQSQHEWELNLNLYHYLDTVCGPHTIDRFATIKTTKCKRYNSRYPGCCGVDALHQSDWAREMSFVNAPLRPLDSVLIIILHQEAEATIIAPARKAKNWFQKLRKLSIASPIRQHAHTFCIQRGLRPPEARKKTLMGIVCLENLWAKALGTELWPPECIKNIHSFLPLPRIEKFKLFCEALYLSHQNFKCNTI